MMPCNAIQSDTTRFRILCITTLQGIFLIQSSHVRQGYAINLRHNNILVIENSQVSDCGYDSLL